MRRDEPSAAPRRLPVDPDLRQDLAGGTIPLDIEDVLAASPHRPPNLLLDRVVTLVPGSHAVGVKAITGAECSPGGLEAGFSFPSTFALEAMAQLASITLTYPAVADAGKPVAPVYQLGSVRRFEVHREVVACGALCLNITVVKRNDEDGAVTIHGHALISGEACADAEFQLVPFAALDTGPLIQASES